MMGKWIQIGEETKKKMNVSRNAGMDTGPGTEY